MPTAPTQPILFASSNTSAERKSAAAPGSLRIGPRVTMASAELTVAKAALSGALFRADPRSCSRDEIESMLLLLSTAISECSPPNVQV